MNLFRKSINKEEKESSKTPTTKITNISQSVEPPDILEQYIEYNKIEHDDNFIYVYKAVDINGCSFYDPTYKYELNKLQTVKNFDDNICTSCTSGIHALPKDKAIRYGFDQRCPRTVTVHYKGAQISMPIKHGSEFKLLKLKINKNKVIIPRRQNGCISLEYGFNSSLLFNADCKIRAQEALVVKEEVMTVEQNIQFTISKIKYDNINNNYKYYYRISIDTHKDMMNYLPTGGYAVRPQIICNPSSQYNDPYFTSTKLDLSKEEIQTYLEAEYKHINEIVSKQQELINQIFTIS